MKLRPGETENGVFSYLLPNCETGGEIGTQAGRRNCSFLIKRLYYGVGFISRATEAGSKTENRLRFCIKLFVRLHLQKTEIKSSREILKPFLSRTNIWTWEISLYPPKWKVNLLMSSGSYWIVIWQWSDTAIVEPKWKTLLILDLTAQSVIIMFPVNPSSHYNWILLRKEDAPLTAQMEENMIWNENISLNSVSREPAYACTSWITL